MRIKPILRENLPPETRFVHDEIVSLVTRSQSPVAMTDKNGALVGPFPPMLAFPQFGIPALSFVRSLDEHATLPKKVKETAILTVGAVLNARFELYAHEIMAKYVGLSKTDVALLAAGERPTTLDELENLAYTIAKVLASGRVLPDSVYRQSLEIFGQEATAELVFLIGAYTLLATILNGFDVPAASSF